MFIITGAKSAKGEMMPALKKIMVLFLLSCSLLFVFFAFSPAELFMDLVAKQFVEGTSSGKTIFLLLYAAFFSAATILLSENKNALRKTQEYGPLALKVFVAGAAAAVILGLFMHFFVQYSIGADSGSYIASIATQGNVTSWEMSYLEHNHVTKSAIFLLLSTVSVDFKNFDTGYPFYVNTPGILFFDVALLAVVFIFFVSSVVFINSKLKTISLFDYLLWVSLSGIFIIAFFDGGVFSHPFRIAVGLSGLFAARNFNLISFCRYGGYAELFVPFALTTVVSLVSFFLSGVNFAAAFLACVPMVGLFTGYGFVFAKSRRTTKEKNKAKFVYALALALLLYSVFSLACLLHHSSNGPEARDTWLFAYGFPLDTTEKSLMHVLEPFSVEEVKLDGWLASIHVNSEKPVRIKEIEQALEKNFRPQGYLDVMEREEMYGDLNFPVFLTIPNQAKFTLFDKNRVLGTNTYTVFWTDSKPDDLKEKLGETISGSKINSIDDSNPLKTVIDVDMKGNFTWGLIAVATHVKKVSGTKKFLVWTGSDSTQELNRAVA